MSELLLLIICPLTLACQIVFCNNSAESEELDHNGTHTTRNTNNTRNNRGHRRRRPTIVEPPITEIDLPHGAQIRSQQQRVTRPSLSRDREQRIQQMRFLTDVGFVLKTSQPEETIVDFGEQPLLSSQSRSPLEKDTAPSSEQGNRKEIQFVEASCGICLEDYQHGDVTRRSRHCEHVFHSHCYLDWLVAAPTSKKEAAHLVFKQPRCPCCRMDVVTRTDLERHASRLMELDV